MIINKEINNEEKLYISPCKLEDFIDLFYSSVGYENTGVLDPDNLDPVIQNQVLSNYIILDWNTNKDITKITGFFKDNNNDKIYNSYGIHRLVQDRLGYKYLVCWISPNRLITNFGLRACFILYFDGTSIRGFVPYKGNPINVIRDSLMYFDEIDYVDEGMDGCQLSIRDIIYKQKEIKDEHKTDKFLNPILGYIEIDYDRCIDNFKKNLIFI